jgi:hypothetical protein
MPCPASDHAEIFLHWRMHICQSQFELPAEKPYSALLLSQTQDLIDIESSGRIGHVWRTIFVKRRYFDAPRGKLPCPDIHQQMKW